jgi:RsiW-degrading membrane proteinase PrsW (M82 family)
MIELPKIIASLLPVLLFLITLVFLDSFKLVSWRSIILAIIIGALSSLASLLVNEGLLSILDIELKTFTRYIAPVVEEILKVIFLVYLIKSKRIGFPVDAAIIGFGIGTGFALVENIYYLAAVYSSNMFLWIIRGFGTAVLHGGTVSIFGIILKSMSDSNPTSKLFIYFPGLFMAIIIHSLFNHFILPPLVSTMALLIFFSVTIIAVFARSEKMTRDWLGIGLDTDAELLELIISGEVVDSKIGRYLESLKTRFSGEVVGDLLCYLQIHLELALRAKGILMMREAGIRTEPDDEIKDRLKELKYLDKTIGKTGKLAIHPFLHTSSRDMWQIYMLRS